jgi:hypothetical protein
MTTNKPSPTQARLLRLLGEPGVKISAHNWGKKMTNCRVIDSRWREVAKINGLTVKALIVKGWIERESWRYNYYKISEAGLAVLQTLADDDFASMPDNHMSAKDVISILNARYEPPNWVFFSELRFGTGYGRLAEQRLDAWAMHCWPSKKFLKIAFEIKISHGDFLKELKNSRKRSAALSVSNQFYFVSPFGIIQKEEVPSECGLMVVIGEKDIRVVKEAPYRIANSPTWMFVAALGRRMLKGE